jgi:hypothetical protein
MTKSTDDAQEQERAELVILVKKALAEGERLEAEANALRKEIARLKRSKVQPGRNSNDAS